MSRFEAWRMSIPASDGPDVSQRLYAWPQGGVSDSRGSLAPPTGTPTPTTDGEHGAMMGRGIAVIRPVRGWWESVAFRSRLSMGGNGHPLTRPRTARENRGVA